MSLSPFIIRSYLSSYQRRVIENNDLLRAAVLLPFFFQKDEKLSLLFTKRTSDVEHHKGQISFPGGMVDASDPDIIATALRESEEEIGLDRKSVELLGVFDDFATPTGYIITPIVGYVAQLPELKINQTEVEEVFDVPVDFFLDNRNERVVPIERDGQVWDVYFYRYKNRHEIWGATAYILHSLLQKLIRSSQYSSSQELSD